MAKVQILKAVILTSILALSGNAYSATVTEKAQQDGVSYVAKGDPLMATAVKHAQSTLDDFFAIYQNPQANQSHFSVKVGVTDKVGGQEITEFFWISDIEVTKDDHYTGILSNTPYDVTNVKLGDQINFSKDEIIDWTYFEGNQMKGSFTTCAILMNEPAAQREEFQKSYGLVCDIF